MKMRLLGDAVLRKVAWEVADQLGSASTYDAEYIALTKLQADALVAMEDDLARRADGLVELASIDALLEGSRLPKGLPRDAWGRSGKRLSCLLWALSGGRQDVPLEVRDVDT